MNSLILGNLMVPKLGRSWPPL